MNKKQPILSIIVPVYNSEKYLERCVDSVLSSTFRDYELLLIDDGSNQATKALLKKIAEKDPRIQVIHQKNQGAAKTRDKGIELATGKYIMFIDNDDYIGCDYLQTYIDTIQASSCDIVIGGYQRITEQKKVINAEKLQPGIFAKFVVMAPWAKIYKTDFLRKNHITFLDYGLGEDIYFNMVAYMYTDKIQIIDNTSYFWFYNTKSVSNTRQKTFSAKRDPLFLLEKILSHSNYEATSLTSYYIIRYCIWYLLFAGRNASKRNFISETQHVFNWLQDKIPNCQTNKFLSKMPTGENFTTYAIVKIILFLWRHNKINLFAKVYCKGGE